MKIKISESQLKKVLSEIGGYDDKEVMAMHGGNIHGEIVRIITQTSEIIKHFVDHIRGGELSKENLMAGVYNLSEKITSDIEILSRLSKEIYLDDDFRLIMKNYIVTLKKSLNYFRLLSDVGLGRMGSDPPKSFVSGLGIEMSNSELSLNIIENISKIASHLDKLGDMFNQIISRFGRRMDSSGDNTEDIY